MNKFFVSNDLYLQTVDVITARAEPLGIEIIFGDASSVELTNEFLARLYNIQMLTVKFMTTVNLLSAKNLDIQVSVIADIMSLVCLKSWKLGSRCRCWFYKDLEFQ